MDHTDNYGTFHTGRAIHDFMGREVGPDLEVDTQREQPIHLEADGLTIVGHVDYYEPGEDIVYDYKSRANWYKFSPPVQRHLDQVYVYMRAMKASRGQIVFLSKADLEVRTWPPQSAGIDPFAFDPARFQDLLVKGKRIAATIIEEDYPTSPADIPIEKDDCWFCQQETLQFDHLQPNVDPLTDLGPAETEPADEDQGDDIDDVATGGTGSQSSADA